jgi:hypothetical protein
MAKAKQSNGRHSRAPPNSKNAALTPKLNKCENKGTGNFNGDREKPRQVGNEFQKCDRHRHVRVIVRGEAGPPFSNFEAP